MNARNLGVHMASAVPGRELWRSPARRAHWNVSFKMASLLVALSGCTGLVLGLFLARVVSCP